MSDELHVAEFERTVHVAAATGLRTFLVRTDVAMAVSDVLARLLTDSLVTPSSVREGGDGACQVFVVLTHDNCFINAYLTREAAEREARDGGGRYLVDRVELPDAEEAPDATA